ncbi:helix-turn-helix domain-containing protein [Plantactinospora solaniradicis]|uniref:Helix-turn-helix domain-containing protein n=1 Tax=Plantactinospora solaniradicis TaxID=1723736 RepID=A0ABW1KL94_9ACTN
MGDGRGPKLALLELTGVERDALETLTRRRSTAQALATRARIILACAQGLSNSEVSRLLGVSLPTVGTWRARFVVHRVDGLYDEPRPGRPRRVGDAEVERVIVEMLESTPRNATHWSSTRSRSSNDNCTATGSNSPRRTGHGWPPCCTRCREPH